MKTTERHHLKDNELAMALNQAQGWLTNNQRTLLVTIGAIVLVGAGVATTGAGSAGVMVGGRSARSGTALLEGVLNGVPDAEGSLRAPPLVAQPLGRQRRMARSGPKAMWRSDVMIAARRFSRTLFSNASRARGKRDAR